MSHNVRILSLNLAEDLAKELRRIDSDRADHDNVANIVDHYVVNLDTVRRSTAHILADTLTAYCGEALLHRQVSSATLTHTGLMLCGTRKQFSQSLHALREQGLHCDNIPAEIEAALNFYEHGPQQPPKLHDHRLTPVFASLGKRTLLMGILNLTPDSFSDGGAYADEGAAVAHAMQMIEDGASIIDVGGESTRPGSDPVDAEEEMRRILPVIRRLASESNTAISIDTYKACVARAALDAGACIVNDISGATFDPEMPALIAEKRCPAILMHILGTPKNMQQNPTYYDLMGELSHYLRARVRAVVEAGADERLLLIDPGFGFGKTPEHNIEILRRLRELRSLGRPIVVGTSRKSTIGKLLGDLPPEERLEGTAATVAISIANGADIVRVHDVREMARVVRVTDAIVRGAGVPIP